MENLYQSFEKCKGVQTDTRTITAGCLFFCLKGANFDGNKFAKEALEKGAAFVVIDNKEYFIDERTILVEDALLSLQNLAREHRRKFNIPVIGITGSNGKTTSKELISTTLSKKYNVHFTRGNLNNQIGVPLTLLQLEPSHEIAVIEMGANKPGDIKELAEIAEPTHGIITNIGRAHLEGFKSLEGVIQTKTELYRFLQASKGEIFVNDKDETLLKNLPGNTIIHHYNNDELAGELVELNPFVVMKWKKGNYESPVLRTHLVGEYNYLNFLAAVSIATHFGVEERLINDAIEEYIPSNNRSQVEKTDNNTVIVDCYNANPTSMSSALKSFAAINNHAKIFILGDMREMGDDAELVHKEILDLTIDLRLSGFFIGEEFLKLKGQHPQAIFLKSTEPLIEHFQHNPPKDLLILLKGSRGIALEKILPYL